VPAVWARNLRMGQGEGSFLEWEWEGCCSVIDDPDTYVWTLVAAVVAAAVGSSSSKETSGLLP
jgi:hypothetical protein